MLETNKDIWTGAVVGLGKIGMGFDLHLSPDDYVLTHVRAFCSHPDFRLVAALDPDTDNRSAFSTLLGLPVYEHLEDLLSAWRPDVIIISSPTPHHFAGTMAILQRYRPRLILCEKPLAGTAAEGQVMVQACEAAEVPLFVNFIRRADPAVQEIRARIAAGTITGPLKAVVWYSKGMLHNGSHFVDLLTYWLGPIRSARLIAKGRARGEGDADADFHMEFENGAALFCAADEDNFSHYTIEITASNGRLRYEKGGEIQWQGIEEDANLKGYRRLAATPDILAGDMNRYQLRVMDELARALRGQPHALCCGTAALESTVWLERLLHERNTFEGNYG